MAYTEVLAPEDGLLMELAIAGGDRNFQPSIVARVQNGKDAQNLGPYDRKRRLFTNLLVEPPIYFRYAGRRGCLANVQVVGNKDLPLAAQRSDDWRREEMLVGLFADASTSPVSHADKGKISDVPESGTISGDRRKKTHQPASDSSFAVDQSTGFAVILGAELESKNRR